MNKKISTLELELNVVTNGIEELREKMERLGTMLDAVDDLVQEIAETKITLDIECDKSSQETEE